MRSSRSDGYNYESVTGAIDGPGVTVSSVLSLLPITTLIDNIVHSMYEAVKHPYGDNKRVNQNC